MAQDISITEAFNEAKDQMSCRAVEEDASKVVLQTSGQREILDDLGKVHRTTLLRHTVFLPRSECLSFFVLCLVKTLKSAKSILKHRPCTEKHTATTAHNSDDSDDLRAQIIDTLPALLNSAAWLKETSQKAVSQKSARKVNSVF